MRFHMIQDDITEILFNPAPAYDVSYKSGNPNACNVSCTITPTGLIVARSKSHDQSFFLKMD